MRLFVVVSLCCVHVFWQGLTTNSLRFEVGLATTRPPSQGANEQDLSVDRSREPTVPPRQTTAIQRPNEQSWSIATSEPTHWETNEARDEANNLTTIRQVTETTTDASPTCCSSITREIFEEAKREVIDSILAALSRQIDEKIATIESYLTKFTCPDTANSSVVDLSWLIYEGLQIPLAGWLRVFEQPYSHKTRTSDLIQLSGICHRHVLVAATFNESIRLAAVGPASVLTLSTAWNRPQQFGQVHWYLTPGKSFGFSPSATIRQTTADNEDPKSSLRLSWLLDQQMGGYRAGPISSIADDPLWRKVIYCN